MAPQPLLCYTQLVGQDKAKRLLGRALATDRVPHAYLFKGPEGVGKKLYSLGFGAAINCHDRSGPSACGICSSCKKFSSGNHPDYTVVRPEKGAIKIGQVRQLCSDLTYPPYESEMRIVVVEDVHTMRPEAANSLLKTLEEPPDNNLLILTAESSQEVLPTLISRCQVVPFFRLPDNATATILVDKGVEPENATLLARLSEGSPGRALVLDKFKLIELLKKILAVLSHKHDERNSPILTVLELAEEMAKLKENLVYLLGFLRIWIRDQLVDLQNGEAGTENISHILQMDSTELKSWSSKQLFAKLRAIDGAEKALGRNCNRMLVCEVLLFKLQ